MMGIWFMSLALEIYSRLLPVNLMPIAIIANPQVCGSVSVRRKIHAGRNTGFDF